MNNPTTAEEILATTSSEQDRSSTINEQHKVLLHMPVDVRSVSLAVLAALACVYTLHWASAVLIPVMLGVMLSYALSPIVDRVGRWHVPRVLSSGVLLVGLVAAVFSAGYSLADDAALLAESLPDAAQQIDTLINSRLSRKEGAIDKVQQAARQLEEIAKARETGEAKSSPGGIQRVQIERGRFDIKDYLWTGAIGVASILGQGVMVLLIAFFLLVSGNTFRRKLVKLAGPRLSQKKVTVQALDEITAQIQRYLLVQGFVSILVGIASWLTFLGIGLKQPEVWGVLAGALNMIPYAGAIVVTAAASLVGLTQFGDLEHVAAIAGASLVIHGLMGHLLTPWLTSRASRINPVVIFVGVMIFGWLWGIWGLLMGAPILMIIKATTDRVQDLNAVSELLEG